MKIDKQWIDTLIRLIKDEKYEFPEKKSGWLQGKTGYELDTISYNLGIDSIINLINKLDIK